LPLAKQVLELNEKVFGRDALMVAKSASTLAELYITKGNYKEAAPLLLRAIEINDKELKPDNPSLIRTLKNYTCILYLSELDKKLQDFETSRLAVLERSSQPDRFWGAVWRVSKPTNVPKPDYPPGVGSGRVLIAATVDEKGKVISTQNMCGGNVLLVRASLESANKAEFKPLVVQGMPVRIIGISLIDFNVNEGFTDAPPTRAWSGLAITVPLFVAVWTSR
jgi:Tetratricopeptide repeat